jgi:hypothetical protein
VAGSEAAHLAVTITLGVNDATAVAWLALSVAKSALVWLSHSLITLVERSSTACSEGRLQEAK